MPNPSRARRAALLLGVAAASATALVAGTLTTPAQAASPAAASSVSAGASAKAAAPVKKSRIVRAKAALTNAQIALAGGTNAKGQRPDATLALRQLWLLKDALSPADRAAAEKLAARPSKESTAETATLSIHYNASELTGYSLNDAISTLSYVADGYANSGYRRPLPDGNIGGSAKTDIYLDQLEGGLYGYCTTDQTRYKGKGHAVWAFCVIDADFAGFPPPRTPLENLQVTAAHEYYHATQFAYDYLEDRWMVEATAAWAEDELYPNVNDNFQYLASSPITKPGRSIDKFESGGVFQYGVWNFFRYLSEHYPAKTGLLPTIGLDYWKAADSTKGPRKDKYSLQAINKVLKKTGKTSLSEQFALYSAATRAPGQTFAEGAALGYPSKPLGGAIALGPAKKKKAFKTRLDHLTSDTFQFVPSGTAGDAQLKVQLRMGKKQTGSRAVAVVYNTAGVIVEVKSIKVNKRGVAKKKIQFGGGVVGAVEITLVNSSQRMRNCEPLKSPYSCGGRPVDQNVRAVVKAKAA